MVVVAHEQGRFRATNAPYAVHWVHIVTCRDGKIVRLVRSSTVMQWKDRRHDEPIVCEVIT